MAELDAGAAKLDAAQPIPVWSQLLAVAWLRWRIFVNGTFLRRKTKQQATGLVFAILLRLMVWPFFAIMAIAPILGCGFLAWQAIAEEKPQNLAPLLAAVTLLWQFVSVNGLNIAAAVSSFDPSSLIRFPLRFGRYLVLRTMFGLLTPSTIVGSLALFAAAVGIGIANPELVFPAMIVLGVYSAMNIFLTRTIEAWMERWLANRRFREIFGMLMALVAISFQFLNFQRAPVRGVAASHSWLLRLLHGSGSYLNWLPPGFAANAILLAGRPVFALLEFIGLLASTALVAATFAIRLHKQFLGEYLSEGLSRSAPARTAKGDLAVVRAAAMPVARQRERWVCSPVIGACLRKEWLLLRGNSTQLIGLLMPLIFIVILTRTTFTLRPTYFLPGAIAYALIGVLAGLYNIFGADGLGVQVYLLAPVRLRDVIVAKNLVGLAMVLAEAGGAWILVSLLSQGRIPLSTQVATGLWTSFVIAANLALGTLRSIQSPRKFVPGQPQRRRGTPTGRTSGLLIFVVLFGSLALQFPVVFLCRYLHQPWLAAMIFGPFAAAAFSAYALVLLNAEKLVMDHRDVLAEELCKA